MRVTIIGIGGIGTHLADDVARVLAYGFSGATLTLVDGDGFEPRNRERQAFTTAGNKAEVKAAELAARFPECALHAVPEFCTPENADFVLPEGEIVLLAVDNHATRKLVADVAAQRQDLAVISGGNEDTWGSIHVHLRRGGHDITPPLTDRHPEIAHPADRRPDERSCEERAVAGAPQLLVTNVYAAACMLAAFWRLATDPDGFATKVVGGVLAEETAYDEVYFDVFRNRARGRRHPVAVRGAATPSGPTDGAEVRA